MSKHPENPEEVLARAHKEASREAHERVYGSVAERRQRKIEERLGQAGVPKRYLGKSFADYHVTLQEQRQVVRVVCAYADRFAAQRKAGRWLALCGEPGTGKTHLACALLQAAIADHYTGVFLTVTQLLTKVRDSYRRNSTKSVSEVVSDLVAPDLLVLDEVGVQKGDEAEQRILFQVLGERYDDMRPCVLIGNVTVEEMETYLGRRIMDRMRENGGAVLAMDWDSYRTKAGTS